MIYLRWVVMSFSIPAEETEEETFLNPSTSEMSGQSCNFSFGIYEKGKFELDNSRLLERSL